jgi:hypothetical protein
VQVVFVQVLVGGNGGPGPAIWRIRETDDIGNTVGGDQDAEAPLQLQQSDILFAIPLRLSLGDMLARPDWRGARQALQQVQTASKRALQYGWSEAGHDLST